jgi:histidinol-phosphate aminotransferase
VKVKDSYNCDALSIAAAAAAIGDQDYFKANVQKVKAERTRLTRELRAMGFDVPDSQTNFVLVTPPGGNAKEIYEALVKWNIFIRYFALPGLENKLRITIGTPQQNDRLLNTLNEING